MTLLCRRRTACRLCDSDRLSLVLSLTPTPPANAFVAGQALGDAQQTFPLDVFFCEACAHVQLLDVVDPGVLFSDYVYVSGTSPVFVKHFEEYARTILDRFKPAPGSLVLDIGSNDGTLLEQFKKAGMNVLGIDPARGIARAATDRGIETLADFFSLPLAEKIREERGSAAVITANNVFAHADDLAGITNGIRRLLAPEGIFVFEVSYLADVYRDTLFDTIYHEHLAYHTVKPLTGFFARHGLELIAAERVSSHGGSLRGIVQHADGPHAVTESVTARIAEEERLGLDKSATLKQFAAKIDGIKQDLTALLRDIKARGETIAGFGAPAKATTLMYHFGLGPDVIDFIVDDSPLKQGLFTPGHHIPVLPSAALYERKPDYALILAWNFAEPIMNNHRKFLQGGGHFIVPLPRARIY
ncbi:MAG: class I SAM-dependent methyltransferase [Rhodospirillales bacterium]